MMRYVKSLYFKLGKENAACEVDARENAKRKHSPQNGWDLGESVFS